MDEPYRASATPDHDREVALEKRLEELRGTDAERAELEGHLHELQAQAKRKRLQLVGSVSVASPCSANWNDMQGSHTQRHCNQCEKSVFNVSVMTEVQAAHFIETEKKACVRFFQRKDGTILTADCAVGLKTRRRRNRFAAAIVAGVGLVGAASLAAAAMRMRSPCTIEGDEVQGLMLRTTGEMEIAPSPPVATPSVTSK
jgi:hypothetical protein